MANREVIERRHAAICAELGDRLYKLEGIGRIAHEDRGELLADNARLRALLAETLERFGIRWMGTRHHSDGFEISFGGVHTLEAESAKR